MVHAIWYSNIGHVKKYFLVCRFRGPLPVQTNSII